MASFLGEYHCKLDNKGRFMMPAGLRKQLDPSAHDQFVINRGYEGCLTLYPMNEWTSISDKLSNLNLFIAANRKFYRQFHNGAKQVGLDNNGRILIPKPLMKFAEIKKDIVLFAYADRVEVWDLAKYEAYMEETRSDVESLAEEVMGNMDADT
ncbi:MAG: division/cell wall cluster transcriptional repressor MraZ [Flavobacteriales bacterium]